MKTWYDLFDYFKGSNYSLGLIYCVPITKEGKYDEWKCQKCLSLPFKVKLMLLNSKARRLLWLRNKKVVVHFE